MANAEYELKFDYKNILVDYVDIDQTEKSCYLPTRKRLEETDGSDWY